MSAGTKERLKKWIDGLSEEAAEELEAALSVRAEERAWHEAFSGYWGTLWGEDEVIYTEEDLDRARRKGGQWSRGT